MGSLRWGVWKIPGLGISGWESHFGKNCPGRRQIQSWSRPILARFKLHRERSSVDDKNEPQEENITSSQAHPYKKLGEIWQSKSHLAKYLIDNQIHNDHGLFVTNKPFGVGVRRRTAKHLSNKTNLGKKQLHLRGLPSCPYTLEDLLPELRHLLQKPHLVLVRSTEKLTSGPAVFAEDEPTSDHFRKCVSSSKSYFDTLYKYHVVTVLPPILPRDPSVTERVGIAVKRFVDSDISQPVITQEYSINSVKRREVVPAHVQSNLLRVGHGGPAYLVEINTSTVDKNFLRIFTADRLAPILGDHLYSDRVQTLKGVPAKIDPSHLSPGAGFQKLSRQLLESLKLQKPEDSLIIPTHIHLRSYKVRKFLPGMTAEAYVEFEAPYPPYFKWTCEQVGITLEADAIHH